MFSSASFSQTVNFQGIDPSFTPSSYTIPVSVTPSPSCTSNDIFTISNIPNWLIVNNTPGNTVSGTAICDTFNNTYSYTYTVRINTANTGSFLPSTQTANLNHSVSFINSIPSDTVNLTILPRLSVDPINNSVDYEGVQGGPSFTLLNLKTITLSGQCDTSSSVNITFSSSDSWIQDPPAQNNVACAANKTYSTSFDINLDNANAGQLTANQYFGAVVFTVDQGSASITTSASVSLKVAVPLTTAATPSPIDFSGDQGGPFTPLSTTQVTISGSCDISLTTPHIIFSSNENWLVKPGLALPNCVGDTYSFLFDVALDPQFANVLSPGQFQDTLTYTVDQGGLSVTASTDINLDVKAPIIPITISSTPGPFNFDGFNGGPFNPSASISVVLSGTCDSASNAPVVDFNPSENWLLQPASLNLNCQAGNYTYSFDIALDANNASLLADGVYPATMEYEVKQNGQTKQSSTAVVLTVNALPVSKKLDKDEAASYAVGRKTMRASTTKQSSIIHGHVKKILKNPGKKYGQSSASNYTSGGISVARYIEQNQDKTLDSVDIASQFIQGAGGLQYGLSGGDANQQKGVWLEATGINLSDSGIRSFSADGNLYMAGFDYQFGEQDNMLVGVSLSYAEMDAKTTYNNGDLDSDEIMLTTYFGLLYDDYLVIDAQLGYGDLDYKQNRNNNAITSSFDANKYFFSINAGLFKRFDQLNLITNLGYLYARENQDSYTESSGDYLSSQTLNFGQVKVGGEVNYMINDNFELISKLDYLYDTKFAQIAGTNDDPSAFDGGIGINFYGGDAFSAGFYVSKIFERKKEDEDSYSFNLNYSF